MDVGDRIRQLRQAAGLRQRDLAEAAGTSQDHICDIERGNHLPGTDLLLRIAAALKIPPAKLLESANKKTNPTP